MFDMIKDGSMSEIQRKMFDRIINKNSGPYYDTRGKSKVVEKPSVSITRKGR